MQRSGGRASTRSSTTSPARPVSKRAANGSAEDVVDGEGSLGNVLFQILPEIIEDRRRNPGDDLISALVNSEIEDAHAGSETVARLLTWTAVVLARNPDRRAADWQLAYPDGTVERCGRRHDRMRRPQARDQELSGWALEAARRSSNDRDRCNTRPA